MVSPTPEDDRYWLAIAEAYRDAQLGILGAIRRRVERGETVAPDDWAVQRLAEVQTLSREVAGALARAGGSYSKIQNSLFDAYREGENEFLYKLRDVAGFLPGGDRKPSAVSTASRRAAVAAVAREVAGGVTEALGGVLRETVDRYQTVVRQVVAATVAGGVDRRKATAQALADAYGSGLRVGPDGRMNLPDYVTMAVRTGTAKAMIQGHLDAMEANGIDLVYIQPGPRMCDRCDDWCNRPLHRGAGAAGVYEVEDLTTGKMVKVKVYGSLDDARRAGWGHPNCRCSVSAFLPGATELPADRPKFDKDAYEAQQRQREIERRIREWKIREQLTTDPTARGQAGAKVAEWQALQRAHLRANPALKRRADRESVAGSYGPGTKPKGPNLPEYDEGPKKRQKTVQELQDEARAGVAERSKSGFRDFFASEGRKWADENLTPPQRAKGAIERYTGMSGDVDLQWYLNKYLSPDHVFNPIIDPPRVKKVEKLLNQLDKVFTPVPEAIMVHRSAGTKTFGELASAFVPPPPVSDMIGRTFAQKGYTSTYIGQVISGVEFDPKVVQVDIRVPKGAPAAWLRPYSKYEEENEVLFPRETKFRVVDVHEEHVDDPTGKVAEGFTRWRVVAEVVI